MLKRPPHLFAFECCGTRFIVKLIKRNQININLLGKFYGNEWEMNS